MQKNILIPTDFEIESLNVLKQALIQNTENELNVILIHGCFLSDSISDLMFYSPQKIIQSLSQPSFHEAVSILKNRFSQNLYNVQIELFHGLNQSAFRNFIQAKKIGTAYIPEKYIFKPHKNSFDVIRYINNSSLSITKVDWKLSSDRSEAGQLNTLFN
jgi:hypothetical protein